MPSIRKAFLGRLGIPRSITLIPPPKKNMFRFPSGRFLYGVDVLRFFRRDLIVLSEWGANASCSHPATLYCRLAEQHPLIQMNLPAPPKPPKPLNPAVVLLGAVQHCASHCWCISFSRVQGTPAGPLTPPDPIVSAPCAMCPHWTYWAK